MLKVREHAALDSDHSGNALPGDNAVPLFFGRRMRPREQPRERRWCHDCVTTNATKSELMGMPAQVVHSTISLIVRLTFPMHAVSE